MEGKSGIRGHSGEPVTQEQRTDASTRRLRRWVAAGALIITVGVAGLSGGAVAHADEDAYRIGCTTGERYYVEGYGCTGGGRLIIDGRKTSYNWMSNQEIRDWRAGIGPIQMV